VWITGLYYDNATGTDEPFTALGGQLTWASGRSTTGEPVSELTPAQRLAGQPKARRLGGAGERPVRRSPGPWPGTSLNHLGRDVGEVPGGLSGPRPAIPLGCPDAPVLSRSLEQSQNSAARYIGPAANGPATPVRRRQKGSQAQAGAVEARTVRRWADRGRRPARPGGVADKRHAARPSERAGGRAPGV
jgi:hypothetical protein